MLLSLCHSLTRILHAIHQLLFINQFADFMGNTIVSLGTDRIVQGQRIRAEAKDIRVLFENRK